MRFVCHTLSFSALLRCLSTLFHFSYPWFALLCPFPNDSPASHTDILPVLPDRFVQILVEMCRCPVSHAATPGFGAAIPVYNILETTCIIVLAHPKYVKAIRGKKTDKKDAKWIADIFKYDLVSGSFILPSDIRQLRDLMRYHWKLTNFTNWSPLKFSWRSCYGTMVKLSAGASLPWFFIYSSIWKLGL